MLRAAGPAAKRRSGALGASQQYACPGPTRPRPLPLPHTDLPDPEMSGSLPSRAVRVAGLANKRPGPEMSGSLPSRASRHPGPPTPGPNPSVSASHFSWHPLAGKANRRRRRRNSHMAMRQPLPHGGLQKRCRPAKLERGGAATGLSVDLATSRRRHVDITRRHGDFTAESAAAGAG